MRCVPLRSEKIKMRTPKVRFQGGGGFWSPPVAIIIRLTPKFFWEVLRMYWKDLEGAFFVLGPQNFFIAIEKLKSCVFWWFRFISFKNFTSEISIGDKMENLKSLPARVCECRIRFRHRTIIWFTLFDRYDPKEVFKSKFWIIKSSQNFFHAFQVGPSCSSKSL